MKIYSKYHLTFVFYKVTISITYFPDQIRYRPIKGESISQVLVNKTP